MESNLVSSLHHQHPTTSHPLRISHHNVGSGGSSGGVTSATTIVQQQSSTATASATCLGSIKSSQASSQQHLYQHILLNNNNNNSNNTTCANHHNHSVVPTPTPHLLHHHSHLFPNNSVASMSNNNNNNQNNNNNASPNNAQPNNNNNQNYAISSNLTAANPNQTIHNNLFNKCKMPIHDLIMTNGIGIGSNHSIINNNNNNNAILNQNLPEKRWTLLEPKRLAIGVCNFKCNKRTTIKSRNAGSTSSQQTLASHCLEFCIADILVIVEQCGQWYRGYHDNNSNNNDSTKLGIFPASYVQVFDQYLNFPLATTSVSLSSYYYTLMDPLFLQVVRTLREWHHFLVKFYRTNTNLDKYQSIRKLIYELIEMCNTLGKDLAPTLWRRRSNQLLKVNSASDGLKDPFSKLYLDEDEAESEESLAKNANGKSKALESSLEELYDRILCRLNRGNLLLNLDIMPSFTHTAFSNNEANYSQLFCSSSPQLQQQYRMEQCTMNRNGKFRPYYIGPHSKYLTYILDYYNRLNRKHNQKLNKPSINSRSTSFSFYSPVHSPNHLNSAPPSPSMTKKYLRRHLLMSIREANFSSLFSNLTDSDQYPVLQIDVYVLRYNNNNSSTSTSQSDTHPYEVISEKYCYRLRANGQVAAKSAVCSSTNVNRALFLDVLSKKPVTNLSSSGSNSGPSFSSQHSDSANYYLVVQVWRYGKMLFNESRTKNMLSATMSTASASLSSGTSVFHTISSSSLSSTAAAAVAAASTTSLSSLTSFVSNVSSSTMFIDKTASSTPDSASIDSSEFGATSFKRSVGFSVIPLLELVSRDQEMKSSCELLNSEELISRLLLSDESLLLSVPVKLYEGDLTPSTLEVLLKYRQSSIIGSNSLAFSSSVSTSSASSSSLSKLSPLPSSYSLLVCAKFISECFPRTHHHQANSIANSFISQSKNISLSPPIQPNSLADSLLLSQSSPISLNTNQKPDLFSKTPSYVIVQKRSFGDLITPGYFRNDFYLTFDYAEFEKGGKAIPKNIEVSVCLITENGIQERSISSGANDEPMTFYRSHIQYHQNSPKWFEHIKINVPLDLFESAHLRFVFCHCSSKERERKFIGFAFLPLADTNGACLVDGDHQLYIYKCDNERKLDEASFYLNVSSGPNEKSMSQSGNSSSTSSIASSIASTSSSSLAASSNLINCRSSKELFHVKTSLVSSKLTQNSDILSLLKWSCTPLDQVYDALQRISRVSGEEMVKFLEDILDAIFALFTTCSGSIESSPQMSLIFRVMVDFLKTLSDPKFASYRTALEKYISNQFSAPLVHAGLVACVKKYIELVIISFQTDSTLPPSLSGVTKRELEFILRCLSVFDWILKIVVQSRILYTKATTSGAQSLLFDETGRAIEIQTTEEFRLEMFSLFSSINRLLSVECKSSDDYLIIAIQESVLNTLPNSFGYLSQILTPLELSKLVKSIVNSNNRTSNDFTPMCTTPTNVPSSTSSKRTIIDAKLLLLQETIRCQYIWSNEEARLELLDTFIRLLNVCISESKYCLNILHEIVVYLIENSPSNCKTRHGTLVNQNFAIKHPCEREIEMLSFGAIDAIVEHIIELTGMVTTSFDLLPINSTAKRTSFSYDNDEDYLGTVLLSFMVMLDFMTLKNYEKLFETRSQRQCKELIIHIFVVFLNALYYFPDNWLEVKMAVNRIILQALTMLKTIMSQEFLNGDKFDAAIWRTYFKLAIAFLTQHRLQLESQPYWKRRLILDSYGGDLRILMGFELVGSWDLIGSHKISFIPNLVPSFVDVTLVPELQLRQATIPIFFDMLAVDYSVNSNLNQVESALIDKLDVVAHKSECDLQFKALFADILTKLIETRKPIWHHDGIKLIRSMSRLLSLLIDYRNELKFKLRGVNEVDDRLLMCTYTLLRFYRDEIDSCNRKSIMLRYVEKLANLHICLGNYSESAFTLKLHSDLLGWTPNESQKKEALCETMLTYFESGQCWEEGVKVCKDLQDIYERNYKYSKLGSILKRHAELLDKILNKPRPDNEYFRVSFYGLDFPSFLQNTTFIFRGLEFEKISSFTHRIQQEFPNAQLLTKNIPSDENITESLCQYIQVFAVKPIAEPPVSPDQSLIFGTPDNVLTFYNTNFVRQFIQDRPIQRAPFDPNNEFKSLWIERTIYTTEKPLPGILRMFQVVCTQVVYLSPIENACETIENMNNELSKLVATYSSENGQRQESLSPLSMRLQGILDAAVNGGIAKYIEAFLSSDFLLSNPDQISNVTRLKNRIAHQIKIVESGLTLHGRLAPPPVRPLHTRLLERFATMRNTVHQANIETSQAILWTPNNSSHSSSCSRPSILSQPLPPIPNAQRLDSSSDPDTSSLSSSSSSNTQNNLCPVVIGQEKLSRVVSSTPPLSHPPPPPPSFVTQSPNSKSAKNKPLPPLPPMSNDSESMSNRGTPSPPVSIQRRHSTIDHLKQAHTITGELPINDDSIYSVPQLPDMLMHCVRHNPIRDNESSVDDSMEFVNGSQQTVNGHGSAGTGSNCGTNSRSIHRSRSIPRSTLSHYNGTNQLENQLLPALHRAQFSQNVHELEQIDSSPPPLPPRSSNLDRSNSLNSGVRSTSIVPPLIPPALPQRLVRKSFSSCNSSFQNNNNHNNSIVEIKHDELEPEPYPTPMDDIEFENLLISSPTPRSDNSQPPSRPAPIIGIEIDESDLPTTPLITNPVSYNNGGNINNKNIQQHRSKSSSLPRMQQFSLDFDSPNNSKLTNSDGS